MSEIYKILLTSALTLSGGIIVLVFGQIVIKFIIEPIQEQSKIIGEIAKSVIFYANIGANVQQHYYDRLKECAEMEEPAKTLMSNRYEEIIKNHWEKADNASVELRKLATNLLGISNTIPFYVFWSFLKYNC